MEKANLLSVCPMLKNKHVLIYIKLDLVKQTMIGLYYENIHARKGNSAASYRRTDRYCQFSISKCLYYNHNLSSVTRRFNFLMRKFLL